MARCVWVGSPVTPLYFPGLGWVGSQMTPGLFSVAQAGERGRVTSALRVLNLELATIAKKK